MGLPSATRLVVSCASREEADAARAEVESALKKEGLAMKPEKTRVVSLEEGIDFLGYRITLRGLWPSEKSVKRFQGKVRSLTLKHDRRGTADVVGRVMLVIRGWTNYFSLSQPDPRMWQLGKWILDRVRYHAIGRRWWRKAVQVLPSAKLYEMGPKLPNTPLKKRTR